MSRVRLSVISGVQAGGTMELQLGQTYSVGSSTDSDIMLRDCHQATLQLIPSAKNVKTIPVIEKHSNQSQAITQKKPKQKQSKVDIAYGDEFSVGGAKLKLELVPISNSSSASKKDQTKLANKSGTDGRNASDRNKRLNDQRKGSNYRVSANAILRLGGLSVIGFVVLGLVLSYSEQRKQAPVKSLAAIETRLSDAELGDIEVARTEGNVIFSGYVATRDQAIRVADFISQQPEPITSRVLVDEEIQDHISEILRINRVEGSVVSLGQGEFVAQTNIGEPELLEKLQSLVEKDVPSVRSLKWVNEPAPVEVVEEKQTDPLLDAGKRVVMVNSESPAYIVTDDESRYFVGSTLPGGYRVASISDGRVTVEKQGVQSELRF